MKARQLSVMIVIGCCLAPIISQARWMNPNLGRFHTMDTYDGNKEEPRSLHKYTYTQNNPVNNTDPSGHDIEDVLAVMDISSSIAARVATSIPKLPAMYSVTWGASRSLTSAEINLARTIYNGNIDYTKTGVDYGKWASWQPKGREMTPDGIIHTGGQTISDYTVAGAKPGWSYGLLPQEGILVHELCHVWQRQHGVNVVMRGLYRNYNYAGPNFGSLAFSDYGVEQQAQMTEDYFYLRNGSTSSTMPSPTPSLTTYQRILPFLPEK